MVKISDRSIWKKVLNEIYQAKEIKWAAILGSQNHPISKKLRITHKQLVQSIKYLELQKLIKEDIRKYLDIPESLILTEKGFNVALENEKAEGQKGLTLVASLAASIVALVALYRFIYLEVGPNLDWGQEVVFFIFFILLLFLGFILLIKTWKLLKENPVD